MIQLIQKIKTIILKVFLEKYKYAVKENSSDDSDNEDCDEENLGESEEESFKENTLMKKMKYINLF